MADMWEFAHLHPWWKHVSPLPIRISWERKSIPARGQRTQTPCHTPPSNWLVPPPHFTILKARKQKNLPFVFRRPWEQRRLATQRQCRKTEKASEKQLSPLPPSSLSKNPLLLVSRQGIGMSLPCVLGLLRGCAGSLRLRLGRLCPNVTLPCSLPEVTQGDHVLLDTVKTPLGAACLLACWRWQQKACLGTYIITQLRASCAVQSFGRPRALC